jgi:hypothetical protein
VTRAQQQQQKIGERYLLLLFSPCNKNPRIGKEKKRFFLFLFWKRSKAAKVAAVSRVDG